MVKEVVSVFSRLASSLEHHGGLVLTESVFHHCWSFPPYDWCLDMPEDSSCFSARKCCNCGSYCVSDLPLGTIWIPVSSASRGTQDIVPDRLSDLLRNCEVRKCTEKSPSTAVPMPSPSSHPTVCDLMEPKAAALRLAGELTSMILRTDVSLVTE